MYPTRNLELRLGFGVTLLRFCLFNGYQCERISRVPRAHNGKMTKREHNLYIEVAVALASLSSEFVVSSASQGCLESRAQAQVLASQFPPDVRLGLSCSLDLAATVNCM